MKNTVAKTPAEIGLSLVVCSGPRGVIRDNGWIAIQYPLQLLDVRRRPIWTGDYHLGIGHVKPAAYRERIVSPVRLTTEEQRMLETWAAKPHVKFVNQQLHADVAAKLATIQKVTPKLEDVCHSLISDGAAFFDGQRFEDWANDSGYDCDSIKARETFDACDKIGRDLTRALSRDEIDSLREWASNY